MTEQTVSPEVQQLFDFLTLMKKDVKELAKLEAEIQTLPVQTSAINFTISSALISVFSATIAVNSRTRFKHPLYRYSIVSIFLISSS
jgi:hypothetical protein